MEALKEFRLDVSKWARGGKGGESMMLNQEGNMCCLGQLCKSLGVSRNALRGQYSPPFVVGAPDYLIANRLEPSTSAYHAMGINDACDYEDGVLPLEVLTPQDKKCLGELAPIFAEWGFEIVPFNFAEEPSGAPAQP